VYIAMRPMFAFSILFASSISRSYQSVHIACQNCFYCMTSMSASSISLAVVNLHTQLCQERNFDLFEIVPIICFSCISS
jgi:hypothetical protein